MLIQVLHSHPLTDSYGHARSFYFAHYDMDRLDARDPAGLHRARPHRYIRDLTGAKLLDPGLGDLALRPGFGTRRAAQAGADWIKA
jgi:hypothetical protein